MRTARHWLLWATLGLLLLSGCGPDVTVVPPRTPVFLYLDRAQDFLRVAILLFDQGREYWGQAIRSLYYTAFTVARMKDFDGLMRSESGFHEKVWNQAAKDARKYFRDTMRRQRIRHDYGIIVPQSHSIENDLRELVDRGRPAFAALFEDARGAVERQHSLCTSDPRACAYCNPAEHTDCVLVAARGRLTEMAADVDVLIGTLPRNSPTAHDQGAAAV